MTVLYFDWFMAIKCDSIDFSPPNLFPLCVSHRPRVLRECLLFIHVLFHIIAKLHQPHKNSFPLMTVLYFDWFMAIKCDSIDFSPPNLFPLCVSHRPRVLRECLLFIHVLFHIIAKLHQPHKNSFPLMTVCYFDWFMVIKCDSIDFSPPTCFLSV